MNIKNVDNLSTYSERQIQERSKTPQAENTVTESSTASQQDTVSLSGEAKLRATALSEATQTPDVRQEKIKELKEKVQNGSYEPDFKKAASNLLLEELQLSES